MGWKRIALEVVERSFLGSMAGVENTGDALFYIGGDEERWGGGVSDVQR
jgi:hypothetical protein